MNRALAEILEMQAEAYAVYVQDALDEADRAHGNDAEAWRLFVHLVLRPPAKITQADIDEATADLRAARSAVTPSATKGKGSDDNA